MVIIDGTMNIHIIVSFYTYPKIAIICGSGIGIAFNNCTNNPQTQVNGFRFTFCDFPMTYWRMNFQYQKAICNILQELKQITNQYAIDRSINTLPLIIDIYFTAIYYILL